MIESFNPDAAAQLRAIRDMVAEQSRKTQADIEAIFEQFGATELVIAIKANVVSVANLGLSSSSTLRPPELRSADTDTQIWNWVDALTTRLTDRSTRMLFDRDAASLVQSLHDEGKIQATPQGMRLAAQAALGAGFAERLPAFPTAKMDELIDMRSELKLPLARYRGAVVRFSKDIEPMLGEDLNFEVQQRWEEIVQPELLGLKDEMADHGLVKEIARSLDVKDIRNFGAWTTGTYLTVAAATDLDALATGMVASATIAGPRVAAVALEAVRARRAATKQAGTGEFFYLYEANRRLEK